MSANCGSCVHWERLEYQYSRSQREAAANGMEGDEWGLCRFIAHDGRRTDEVFIDGAFKWVEKPASRLAYCTDASDYHGSLITRPDFGCIEHAARPTSEETPA